MSANSGEPCCANGVASIRRVAKPKSSLRSTHMPSEVPCKPSHHRCALAIRSAQTAPPTVCAGRPSRCAGGRRIRVLHSDPRSRCRALSSLGFRIHSSHAPRHPCLTLPSRGRATSGFASCRPPLMSNVSPQLNVAVASSVRRSREQCGVAHQTVTRAGDAPKCGEPSAHAVGARAKGTALRRRGRANCVCPASADLRFGKQAGQRVYAIHERKSSARCHTAGEEGSL